MNRWFQFRDATGRIEHCQGARGGRPTPRCTFSPGWRLLSHPVLGAAVLLFLIGLAGASGWAQGHHQPAAEERARPREVPPPPEGISFITQLEPTAVWVGDQFHYSIIVNHSPTYEFVLENLTRETVNLDPLHVIDIRKEVTTLKDGHTQIFLDIILTSFATGQESELIPQVTLFFFERNQALTGAAEAAAESLTIPGRVIGLRSTLTPDTNDIRDAITVSGWVRSRWVLAGAGWLAFVILVAGVSWETALFVRKRKGRKGPDRRKAMEAVRARWASSVPSDFSSPETVLGFYTQSYQDVKEYLSYYLETPTLGLTAEELQEEMQRLGTNTEFSQKVVGLLGALDTARYSPNGATPNPEVAHQTAQQVREILAAGSKG